ncbi:MAG: hypothetical protein AABX13_03725 [Nanoarchaeota archaeon]
MVISRILARIGLAPAVDPAYYYPIRPLTSYLLLPGRSHGKYEYPDTLVSWERLPYKNNDNNDKDQNKNSAKNFDRHRFHEGLHRQHAFALSLRQGIDFLLLLKSPEKLYDGKGNRLPDSRRITLLHELLTQSGTVESEEQLDAYFDIKEGVLTLQTEHRFNRQGKLEPFYSEEVGAALRKDCSIDLSSCNRAGLPLKEGTDLKYIHPRPGSMAKFQVERKEGLTLHCAVDPHFHSPQTYYQVRECCYKL